VAREPGQTAVIRDLARALRTHMVEVGDQGLAKLESRLAQLVAGQ